MPNLFDMAVCVLLVLCVYLGWRNGLIRTVFRLASFFVAAWLSGRLYPYAGALLRQTALYDRVKDAIIQSMNLRAVIGEQTASVLSQEDLFTSLPLPDALRASLVSHNTPDIYETLGVATIEDYIGGFFANIVMNVVAMVLVYVGVWVLVRMLGHVLEAVAQLPVINTVNRAGGVAAGLLTGVATVWIALALTHLFFMNPAHPQVFALLDASLIARWFYEHNWLLPALTAVG